jgi:hypothetical protein
MDQDFHTIVMQVICRTIQSFKKKRAATSCSFLMMRKVTILQQSLHIIIKRNE